MTAQNEIVLELSDALRQEQIVTRYTANLKTSHFTIELNHKYDKKVINSQLQEDNWQKTIKTLGEELKRKHIRQEHITMLCDTADDNSSKILNQFFDAVDQEHNRQDGKTADKLLTLAKEQCDELFVDQYGEPYAAIKVDDHLEVLNLTQTRFKNWISRMYYRKGGVPNPESVTSAINILKADTDFTGKSKELCLRVANGSNGSNDVSIFYDLTNKNWEAVKITPEGWSIEKSPAIFRRHNAQSQVYPSREYPSDIFDQFMKLLNIQDEGRRLLLKCYIIAAFIPDIDRIILAPHGSPGAAKSTLQEMIKMVIDPSTILLFALTYDKSELIQQLDHHYVVFYDNVSGIPEWVSDALCRASTGGGSSKRKLFTDDDDKIYNFKRLTGFNGVNLAASRSDLLDRCLIFPIERIDDKDTKQKSQIWQQFEEIRPKLLGYIFDILVKFLRMRHDTIIEFEKLPRMADFAQTAEIISRCMGNENKLFMNAYYKNISLQTDQILQSSLVASAVIEFMKSTLGEDWKGSATELLGRLDNQVSEKILKSKYWPKIPNILSRRLNEVKQNLRESGIIIDEGEQDTVTRVKNIMITVDPTIKEKYRSYRSYRAQLFEFLHDFT